MNIIAFTEDLLTQMKEQANTISDSAKPLEGTARMIHVIQDLIADLQQFTYNYSFASKEEEIRFFKEAKPVLASQFYYYKKLFSIKLHDSFKDWDKRKEYYSNILTRLERFARQHSKFYLYCMTGQNYLDDHYFIRNQSSFSPSLDKRFSTGYDETLSRLLANELLKEYVLDMLRRSGSVHAASPVSWTGKKTDAVELLYALHASGEFNNGEAEVKQIMEAFEELFNIKFGNYYDTLKKIRTRKTGQTPFLDSLKNKLLTRLDEMDK